MKIYYISSAILSSHRASAVHAMKACQSFVRARAPEDGGPHDVTLFAQGKHGSRENGQDVFENFQIENPFQLVLAPRLPVKILGAAARILHTLFQTARRGRPDVYYARDAVTLALLSGGHIPLYYEAHQMPYSGADRWAVNTLMKSPALRGIVVSSEALKEDWIKTFPHYDRNHLLVAQDGADLFPENVTPLPHWPGRTHIPQIGYTGCLLKGRGIDMIQILAERLPEMDFHVVGGSDRDLRYWRGQILPPNLHFHGHVKHAALPAYYERFDILLAPYQHSIATESGADVARWLSPMKIFEYMASGKPILCSDLKVLREILSSGENAGMLPADQPGAWVDALCYLTKDTGMAAALGARAKQDVEQYYLWDIRAERILDFILETKEKPRNDL